MVATKQQAVASAIHGWCCINLRQVCRDAKEAKVRRKLRNIWRRWERRSSRLTDLNYLLNSQIKAFTVKREQFKLHEWEVEVKNSRIT